MYGLDGLESMARPKTRLNASAWGERRAVEGRRELSAPAQEERRQTRLHQGVERLLHLLEHHVRVARRRDSAATRDVNHVDSMNGDDLVVITYGVIKENFFHRPVPVALAPRLDGVVNISKFSSSPLMAKSASST